MVDLTLLDELEGASKAEEKDTTGTGGGAVCASWPEMTVTVSRGLMVSDGDNVYSSWRYSRDALWGLLGEQL